LNLVGIVHGNCGVAIGTGLVVPAAAAGVNALNPTP